jgi:hypothetical protein
MRCKFATPAQNSSFNIAALALSIDAHRRCNTVCRCGSCLTVTVSEMHWFRSIRRFGAGLGLFALLLQLALSFHHLHPEKLLPRSFASLADQVAAKANLPVASQDRRTPGSPQDCPICSVMHLAGTIVVPSPPLLLLPTQFTTASFTIRNLSYIPLTRRLAFQTRAPPTA